MKRNKKKSLPFFREIDSQCNLLVKRWFHGFFVKNSFSSLVSPIHLSKISSLKGDLKSQIDHGKLVDESIEKMQKDMEPLNRENQMLKNRYVYMCLGKFNLE